MVRDIGRIRGKEVINLNENEKYNDILSFLMTNQQTKEDNEITSVIEDISFEINKTNTVSVDNRKKLNLLSNSKRQEQKETQEKINTLSFSEVEQEEKIQKLQEQLREEQHRYKVAIQEKNNLESLLKNMQLQVKENTVSQNKIQCLSQNIEEKETMIRELELSLSKFNQTEQNNKILTEEKEKLHQKILMYQNQLSEYREQEKKQAIDNINHNQKELQEKLFSLEKTYQEETLKLQEKEKQIEDYTKLLQKLRDEQDSLKCQKNYFLTKEKNLQEELDNIKKLQEQSEKLVKTQQQELKEKDVYIQQQQEEIKQKRWEILTTKEELQKEKESVVTVTEEKNRLEESLKKKEKQMKALKTAMLKNSSDIYVIYSNYSRIGSSFSAIYLAFLLSKKADRVALLDLSLFSDNVSLSAFFNHVDIERYKRYRELFTKNINVVKDEMSLYRYKNIEVFTTAFIDKKQYSTKEILQAISNLKDYTIVINLPKENQELLQTMFSINKVEKYLVVQNREDIIQRIVDDLNFGVETMYFNFNVIFNFDKGDDKTSALEKLQDKITVNEILSVREISRKEIMKFQNEFKIFELLEKIKKENEL